MKTKRFAFSLLISLLFSSFVGAQNNNCDDPTETKYMLSSNINESENKEKLLEKLDEIKTSLGEKQEQLHQLDYRSQKLMQHKRALEEVSYGMCELSFLHIGEALAKNETGLQMLEESRLKGRLLHFFSSFEMSDSLSYPENKDLKYVYASAGTLLENLKTEASLSAFLNSESEGCFFHDSLQMDSLRVLLCGGAMNSLQDALKDAMLKEQDHIQEQQSDLEQELNLLKGIKRKIQDKVEGEANIDLFSILLGLPLFCFTIIFLFIGPGWIHAKYGKGTLNPLLERSQSILLDLSTVLLLTMSVLILGLSGNINGDVLGTLIGGISGYVLNKVKV